MRTVRLDHHGDVDPAEVVARLGGVARRRQLLRRTTSRELAAAVADGSVLRLARGGYGLPTADATHAAAVRLDGTISHLSAAVQHGWDVLVAPARPWIAVPRNRNVAASRRRGVRLVWAEASEIVGRSVTSPLRTVLDCARTLPLTEALTVADSALRSGTVDLDELRAAAGSLRGGGAVRARRVLLEATPLAQSPLESALRAIALDVPLLHLVPQAPVRLGDLTVHPDLVDERLRLVVEAEGWVHHAGKKQYARDLDRYTAMLVHRWTPARFGHDTIVFDPDGVRRTLESLARTGTMRRSCPRCA